MLNPSIRCHDKIMTHCLSRRFAKSPRKVHETNGYMKNKSTEGGREEIAKDEKSPTTMITLSVCVPGRVTVVIRGMGAGSHCRRPTLCGEGRGPKVWEGGSADESRGPSWASPARHVGHMSARRRDYESSRHIREPYAHMRDFMAPSVVTFKPDTPLEEVLPLFDEFSGFPVVNDEGRCIGVLSEKDVLHLLEDPAEEQGCEELTVGDFMSRREPITIREGAPILYAASLMNEHNVYRLPVTDKAGIVVGCISRADIFVSEDSSLGSVDPIYRAHPGAEFYDEDDMDFVDQTDV